MLRSVWLVLLPCAFAFAFADKGRGKDDDEDVVISTTSPTNSSTINGVVAMTTPARSSGINSAASTTWSVSPNGSSTYTSMYPASTTLAPAIHFFMPSNATTCTPVMFQWQVIPPSSNVTEINVRLLITNDGVQQAPPYDSSTAADMPQTRRQLPSIVVSRDITNRTSLASGAYNWSAITVPEGWYILEASPANTYRTELASQSAQFHIIAGPNTTCVSPNVSNSAFPATTSHSGLSPGALAGTVVGTIVGLAALLGAFALPRLWRKGVPEHPAWKAKRGGLYHVF